MSQILSDIKKHGMPDLTSRKDSRDAGNLIVGDTTIYGPMMQHITCTGEDVKTSIFPPLVLLASLATAIRDCPPFAKLLRLRLTERPSTPESPWTIVIYSDEVTPGNALALMHARKLQAV